MPPPVGEAIGLALSSASLAQLPVVEGVRSIWQRTHYDYSKDFTDIRERLKTLEMQVQLLHQDQVFDRAAADTPEYKAISRMKEVTAAINGAKKLSKGYALLPSEDQKKWRESNEALLRSLMDSVHNGIEYILIFYSIYSKVKASEIHSRLERWLDQEEGKDEEHRGTEEVVRDGRGEGYASEGEEEVVEEVEAVEGQQIAYMGILNPNVVYFSLFVFFVSMVAVGRSSK